MGGIYQSRAVMASALVTAVVLVMAACAGEETRAPTAAPTSVASTAQPTYTPAPTATGVPIPVSTPTSIPRPQPTPKSIPQLQPIPPATMRPQRSPTSALPTARPTPTSEPDQPPRSLPIVGVPRLSCPVDGRTIESAVNVESKTGAVAAFLAPATQSPIGGAIEAKWLLSVPDTRAISLIYNPKTRRAAIIGQAGAVPKGSSLFVGNTEINDFVMLIADSSGAFATEIAAAPGTHVLIKQDVTGSMNPMRPGMADNDMIAPGVMLRVPVEPADDGIAFGAGARLCCSTPWIMEGTFELDKLSPGQRFEIDGRVAVLTDSLDLPLATQLIFYAELIADADGRQVGRAGKFITPLLTQTGLPIERDLPGDSPTGHYIWLGNANLAWELGESEWVADFAITVRVPWEIPSGLYSLIAGGLWEVRKVPPDPAAFLRTVTFSVRDDNARFANLGAITIGDTQPMRLASTLLADQLSEGSRGGLLAREDQGLFAISARAVTHHDPVIPRLDGYGEQWAYSLGPYLPMLDAVDRSVPSSPSLHLDFTDSRLTVTIERPDGSIDILGPAPLTRYAVKSPRTPWNVGVGLGGGELREVPQLLGPGDDFTYQFPTDGEYVITLDGHIAGMNGRRYMIQGTFDLTIANILDIETALLPTTPFEVGDRMPIAVTIMPQVPADVFFTVTQVGADGGFKSETFRGRANRNGWWDGNGETWTFEGDGEYRVDVQACYSDVQRGSWAGRLRFGGVVATPNSPMIAHGRRGSDGLVEIAAAWGFESDYVYRDPITAPHMHVPYFTGDILWGIEQLHIERANQRNAGTAVVTHMSVQPRDDNHPLILRARQQAQRHGNYDRQTAEAMIRAGQIPLITALESGNHTYGAHPDDIDLWAYVYNSAERPGVRVREIIKGDDVGGSYWRFNDAYHMQSGNGRQGDLPGDFKFLYGGAVIRDASEGEGIYAIYGSSWVLLPNDDTLGARVMPPFQGAAGGPNGGPLFTVHGRDIDMFFMPMGVRPGAVLETGDTFRMAGPIMPTLPSLVDYTVFAPDGTRRTFGGRANAIGYFYDPDDDFVLDQPGLWKVELTVTHDGMTSAGPVEQPYPTGGLLTPDGTTFTFSVIDQNTNRLEIITDLEDLTPAEWFTNIRQASFQTTLPSGWTGNEARLTVTMPGIVLIDKMVAIDSGLVVWELDGEALNKLAKNFDYEQGIADTITVTIFAEGSVGGIPAMAAGTIVTHGARVPRVPPTR